MFLLVDIPQYVLENIKLDFNDYKSSFEYKMNYEVESSNLNLIPLITWLHKYNWKNIFMLN